VTVHCLVCYKNLKGNGLAMMVVTLTVFSLL